MSVEAASRSIAVTFSGWLNVTIPDAGRDARRFLVEPLSADVFVAGTFLPTDCATARDGRCLLERLKHLQPLTGVDLAPMLTHNQLHRHALGAPAFGPISRNLKVRELFNGLNLFAPVLGNPNVSCMRELHDLHRVWALVRAHEAGPRGGAKYRRIVFSRLEFRWLAPPPPLALLEPQVLWVPSGQNVNGVNDRHAVMHRDHAPAYFGRWQFLLSDQLLRRIDLVTATHIGPEQLLGLVLEQARYLPISLYISLYLPTSPYISVLEQARYLSISPYISLYLPTSRSSSRRGRPSGRASSRTSPTSRAAMRPTAALLGRDATASRAGRGASTRRRRGRAVHGRGATPPGTSLAAGRPRPCWPRLRSPRTAAAASRCVASTGTRCTTRCCTGATCSARRRATGPCLASWPRSGDGRRG